MYQQRPVSAYRSLYFTSPQEQQGFAALGRLKAAQTQEQARQEAEQQNFTPQTGINSALGAHTAWEAGSYLDDLLAGANVMGTAPEAPEIISALGSAGPASAYGESLAPAAGSSALGTLAAVPAALETGIQSWEGLSKIPSGQDLSVREQVALALPTFGVSFAYNPIKNLFGSGKGKDQQERDAVRSNLRETGFINKDWGIPLPGGGSYDIGTERGAGQGTHPAQVDFTRPEIDQAVAMANPLAALATKDDGRLMSDYAGYFANAAMSQGDWQENIRDMYSRMGIGSQRDALAALEALKGNIPDDLYAVFVNSINTFNW